MSAWIDYKALRGQLDFAAVLRDYGVELRAKGDQHVGFCPLPGHEGKRNSPSFSANLRKKIFQCFGCRRSGNAIDFACLMENLSPENPRNIYQVAKNLHKKYVAGNGVAASHEARPGPKPKAAREPEQKDFFPAPPEKSVLINAPLDFALQGLDAAHPYLTERGFSPGTVRHFGLGFCGRGYLKGRIAIPLHSSDGKLVGYAGRSLQSEGFTADEPKYRLPGARERNGARHEFQKGLFLYNGHRVADAGDDLIVVEGFASVWWLHQHGYRNAVALMGSRLSDAQARLLLEKTTPGGTLWLMPDGDHAGVACANEMLAALAPHRACRWAKLEAGRQPTDCTKGQLAGLLPTREEKPASKRSSRSLKVRLMEKEVSAKQAAIELANAFPSLRQFRWEAKTWDAREIDRTCAGLPAAARFAVQFILRVWKGSGEWVSEPFDATQALDVWDAEHRRAFLDWASDPWWA